VKGGIMNYLGTATCISINELPDATIEQYIVASVAIFILIFVSILIGNKLDNLYDK
jgi:hypothetical protein